MFAEISKPIDNILLRIAFQRIYFFKVNLLHLQQKSQIAHFVIRAIAIISHRIQLIRHSKALSNGSRDAHYTAS